VLRVEQEQRGLPASDLDQAGLEEVPADPEPHGEKKDGIETAEQARRNADERVRDPIERHLIALHCRVRSIETERGRAESCERVESREQPECRAGVEAPRPRAAGVERVPERLAIGEALRECERARVE